MGHVQLETPAAEFAKATAKPPYLFELGPEKGRAEVDKAQSGPIDKPEVDVEDLIIEHNGRNVSVRVLRPIGALRPTPVVVYIHGAGWVFGNAHTHDRLVRELVVGADTAVVFPNYSLSPEAQYPTALEECLAVIGWVEEQAVSQGFMPETLTVAGDSVGGNLTAAACLSILHHGGPKIRQQLLFYPVTDAGFDTPSYQEFAEGFFLRRDAMQWFWDQYLPDLDRRAEITASPLRATVEQLRGLPRAFIATAEADVLRDEGEAYANALRRAGVPTTSVRFQGIIHDFVMLNDLASTQASHAALSMACLWLQEGFSHGD